MALLLVAGTASAYRVTPACDTYSLFYAVLLAAGGAGLAAISFLPRHRLAALAGLALALLMAAALLNHGCLAGPYAGMAPQIKAIFLDRINEAKPVWLFAAMAPSETIAGYGYGLFALAMTLLAPRGRARTLVLAAAAMALLVAALQVRAVPFVILFALPGLAAALVRLLTRRSVVLLAAAILMAGDTSFALAGSAIEGQAHLAARVARFERQEACGTEAAVAVLNRLPMGRVAAFVDQGPAILAYTSDSAIAGPYHRDAAGILDTYAIFAGADPRGVLAKRGIGYLMICKGAPDWDYYRARAPHGLMAQLAAGQAPGWLTPLGGDGNVALYRIR